MTQDTSWGGVAGWYHRFLEREEGAYQKTVILPNLVRLLDIKRNEMIVDLGCGQGFFARELYKKGARASGVDVSKELIGLARQHSPKEIQFYAAPAHKLDFLKDGSADAVVMVLAVQNIENPGEVFAECRRVLTRGGRLLLVTTHPAFRVPHGSEWGWDAAKKIQYRRVDQYLSESKVKIQMRPGEHPQAHTITFHRPLQFYFKALGKNGFRVRRLEEWISDRTSQPGPRAKAGTLARHEIPLFMALEATT